MLVNKPETEHLISKMKNPNYNPNDPASLRYIQNQVGFGTSIANIGKGISSPLNSAMGSVAPVTQKAPTPTNIPTPPIVRPTAPVQPAMQPVQNMSVPAPTVQNGAVPSPINYEELARQAGQGGIAFNDFASMVGGNDRATRDQINADRGIDTLATSLFQKPEKSTIEIYNNLYRSAGLKSIQQSIKKLDEQIAEKNKYLNEGISEIEGNPWISQATRTGRLAQLRDQANREIQAIVDQRTSYLDQYDRGVTEVEKAVGFMNKDFALEREIGTEQLNYLLNEAEKDLEGTKLSENLRYVPEFLKGVENAKTKDQARELALINARNASSGSSAVGSPQAQNIIALLNSRGGTVDDYVKGTNKDANALRAEVYSLLAQQGGFAEGEQAGYDNLKASITTLVQDLEDEVALAGSFGVRNDWTNLTANERTAFVNKTEALQGQLLSLGGPALKNIFGPQISNADIGMIQKIISQGLDPKNQTPAEFQATLGRIKQEMMRKDTARTTDYGQSAYTQSQYGQQGKTSTGGEVDLSDLPWDE